MSKTLKDVILSTPAARARLKASGKPYYRMIDPGLHLGYRKGKTGGRWVVRWYAGGQKYQVETIGTADDTADADGIAVLSFGQAQEIARDRRVEKARAARGLPPSSAGPYTVSVALEEYISDLDGHRKTSADARYRTDAMIVPELGNILVTDLTTDQIKKWVRGMASAAPRLRTPKGKKQKFGWKPEKIDRKLETEEQKKKREEWERRRQSSANRTLTVLKAALTHAFKNNRIDSDSEWRRVEPFESVDAARVRYLEVKEAIRLINASDLDFRRLVQAALQTGCRYGELCRLDVGDFNSDSGTVHIRKSKSGKVRYVYLTDEGMALFKLLAAGRNGGDPMLVKHRIIRGKVVDGVKQPGTVTEGRWKPAHQSRPLALACGRAKIDPPIDFHCLRHTFASLSIMGGAPLIVVAKQLGHADTRMVEKHYGHLSDSYVAAEIRASAPRFGAIKGGNVAVMEKPR